MVYDNFLIGKWKQLLLWLHMALLELFLELHYSKPVMILIQLKSLKSLFKKKKSYSLTQAKRWFHINMSNAYIFQ